MLGKCEEAIRFFSSEKKTSRSAKKYAEILRECASERGLSADHLDSLSKVVTCPDTSPSLAQFLLKCMVPEGQVTNDVVVNLAGGLCSKRMPDSLKRHVVQWMCAVFHLLDGGCNRVLLVRVLLSLLDTSVASCAANLLVLLASKQTATSFAMSRIAKASEKKPSELLFLGTVFEKCRSGPAAHVTFSNASVDALGMAWQECMHQVQRDLFGYIMHPYTAKALPPPDIFHNGDTRFKMNNSPESLTALLESPSIAKCFANEGGQQLRARLDRQLRAELNKVFQSPESDTGKKLLGQVVVLSKTLQELPPCVEACLAVWLNFWDGDQYAEEILALVSLFPMASPEIFFLSILKPLFLRSFFLGLDMQIKVFQCLSNLCHFWSAVEVPRLQGRRRSFFERMYEPDVMIEALPRLVVNLDLIAMALLQLNPDHMVEVTMHVLDLYLLRLEVQKQTRVAVLSQPLWECLIISAYSSSPLLLESVSKVLYRHLRSLEQLRDHVAQPWVRSMLVEHDCQVAWLGLVLRGGMREAGAIGPCLRSETLQAAGLPEPGSRDSPLALWWQPALQGDVEALCRKYSVLPRDLPMDQKMWKAFVSIVARYHLHTAELLWRCSRWSEAP